ncbi:MAG: hypothetical protein ACRDY1_09225 [Acidimicrobiales bacterium]
MPDAPDPFGKRALYWAPAEREQDGPRAPGGDAVVGKHALFSEAGAAAVRTRPPAPSPGAGTTGRARHPSNGRSADGGEGAVADAVGHDRRTGVAESLERPVGSGMFGSLTLDCSACRTRSQIDLVEFVVLHLPLWFWRPGRGYTRFMTCPACRRRTWVSASWTSWLR